MSGTTKRAVESVESSWYVRPRSRLGWWAVALAIAFVVFFVLNGPLFMSGLIQLGQIAGLIWAVVWFGSGAAAGVLSILALTVKRDRSLLLLIPLIPLAFVVFFLVGEFLFPH